MDQTHYAVDIKTKAHRTLEDHERLKPRERLVIGDADGWIEWHGGECPLPEESAAEFTRRGHGGIRYVVKASAGAQRWDHRGFYSDIIAYRPFLEPQAEHPKEWLGPEDGLPPVGCECEFEHAEEGGWVNAKVIGYDGPACVVALDGLGYSGSDNPRDFRPIRTERERWTDAAMEAAECHDSAPLIRQYFEAIYDTGLARLPEDV